MEKKLSFVDNISNLGFGLYLVTIGSIGYLAAKGVKKMLDILAESLLQKYIESIRNEVRVYLAPMNDKLDDLEKEVEKIKNHESNNSQYQVTLLQELKDLMKKDL